MKILINRRCVQGPWGGGNKFVKGFWEYAPDFGIDITHQFSRDINAILVIGCLPYDDVRIGFNEIMSYKFNFPDVKIITRMNDHDIVREARNSFDGEKIQLSRFFDSTVFVSKWLEEYYSSKDWLCQSNIVINNGVDDKIFKRTENKLSKINHKINVVTHHWSSHPGKGFETYKLVEDFCEKNKDRFTFTYIGRHPGCFKKDNVVDPIFGQELGDELAKYDLYISASKYESGPNHVLEALACEISVLLHEKSGGANNWVTSKNYFSDWRSLEAMLESSSYSNIVEYKPDSMRECVRKYVEHIKEVVNV